MIRQFLLAMFVIGVLASSAMADPPKKLLLLAQGPDGHPPTTHEYAAGLRLLHKLLAPIQGLDLSLVRADEPWKEGPDLLSRADGVVIFLSEGGKWMNADPKRFAALQALAARRGGIVGLHWGIGTRSADNIDACLQILGGCHGGPDRKHLVVETRFQPVDKHPITTALQSFLLKEEFYYRLKFAKTGTITPLVTASIDGRDETVSWAWQRSDGGRSFGFTGLHFHENWKHESYRRLVAQGVLWSMRLPIPEKGLAVNLSDDELRLPK